MPFDILEDPNIEVVWSYIPKTSQELVVSCPSSEILNHGTRGPGKTAMQLYNFRKMVGLGYGKFYRGVIFDFEFKNLDDIINQSEKFFDLFDDGAKFIRSASKLIWTWPTGEALLFRHAKKPSDYRTYHGHEYPFIGWNELTNQPTGELYELMMSTNRNSFDPIKDTPKTIDKDGNTVYDTLDGLPLPPLKNIVHSTTNSNGPGHYWVKEKFIEGKKDGRIYNTEYEIISPKTGKKAIVNKTQCAIFGSFVENKYLSEDYIATLMHLCRNDPSLRKSWIEGSWDISSGNVFSHMWNTEVHVIDQIKVPEGWYVDRSMDWGSSTPFCVLWCAVANGEEAEFFDGRKFCPQAGSLVFFYELYGSEHIGTNKGLGWGASRVAEEILACDQKLRDAGVIVGKIHDGPADNQIFNEIDADHPSIATSMENKGLTWERSNKKPGSRVLGKNEFLELLAASLMREGAGVYFTTSCKACLKIIPQLPPCDKNPEDVMKDGIEDHCWDTVRYKALHDNDGGSFKIESYYG